MPRRNVQYAPGAYYHMYNRGARRQSICYGERDYLHLLGLVGKVARECQLSIIAYCLLPNHYHWLVRQEGVIDASVLPKRVFGSYSQSFNRWYQRSGTLFEGRVKVKPVTDDSYIRHLCRYIHVNPVRHAIADAPELWPYSNYAEWIGRRNGTLVDREFVDEWFPQPGAYERYVTAFLHGESQTPAGIRDHLEDAP